MLLEVKDLNTFYGASHVLQGISLNVADGELVALLGRNGMGKSTTLKTIMGLVKSKSGSVVFEGNGDYGFSAVSRRPRRASAMFPRSGAFFRSSPFWTTCFWASRAARSKTRTIPTSGRSDRIYQSLSEAGGALQLPGAVPVRRRAADAVDRPRADGKSQAALGG